MYFPSSGHKWSLNNLRNGINQCVHMKNFILCVILLTVVQNTSLTTQSRRSLFINNSFSLAITNAVSFCAPFWTLILPAVHHIKSIVLGWKNGVDWKRYWSLYTSRNNFTIRQLKYTIETCILNWIGWNEFGKWALSVESSATERVWDWVCNESIN